MEKEIKTVVILCGSHSGSSMLAGCLHRMGVEMEDEESHKEIGGIHPKGMWERKEFEVMNDRILDRAGGSWHHPPEEERIKHLVGDDDLALEIKRLVEKTQKPLWGWKDPRNALTIPVWHPHLVNPHYIVLARKFSSMADSYMCKEYRWKFGRDFKKREDALKHISEYHNRIFHFVIENHKFLLLSYEAILEKPEFILGYLESFIGIKVNQEALEMVDPTLRHF